MAKDDIYIIRLTSGDTLIARLEKSLKEDGSDTIRVNKPGLIFTQTDPKNGRQQVGIAPFAPFVKGESVALLRSGLQYEPAICGTKELIQNYTEATSGIIAPKVPGLIV